TFAVIFYGIKDGFDNLRGRRASCRLHDSLDPSAAKLLSLGTDRIDDTVTEEDEEITGFGIDRDLFILSIVEKPGRQPCGLDDLNSFLATEDRSWRAGIGYLHELSIIVPHCVEQRDVLCGDLALAERSVNRGQHLGWSWLSWRLGTQNSAYQGCI